MFINLMRASLRSFPVLYKLYTKPAVINKFVAHSVFFLSATNVVHAQSECDKENHAEKIKLTEELEKACTKNNEALSELINTLNMCIDEICEQYQHCVAKQIEITLRCMSMDPVGTHWDDITKYRVEASDLKLELEKYGLLIERLGQMIESHTHNYVSLGKENACNLITYSYEQLKDFVNQKTQENKSWDTKLLEVNTESILKGNIKLN